MWVTVKNNTWTLINVFPKNISDLEGDMAVGETTVYLPEGSLTNWRLS